MIELGCVVRGGLLTPNWDNAAGGSLLGPVIRGVMGAAAGSAYLDPQVAHHVLSGVRAPGSAPLLTSHELEVLRLIADGLPNKDIAALLGISVSTVKLYVQEVLIKLQVADRTQAAVKALCQGWL